MGTRFLFTVVSKKSTGNFTTQEPEGQKNVAQARSTGMKSSCCEEVSVFTEPEGAFLPSWADRNQAGADPLHLQLLIECLDAGRQS